MFHDKKLVSVVAVLLTVLLASQIYAQTPTATPTPVVKASPTTAPEVLATLTTRQAVVKRTIDGDSIEVVFVDGGETAVVHLANVDAPESITAIECFGRESAEYATQAYLSSPLISIELTGEIKEGEGTGYVHLADGTFLNLVTVLFGYARYDGSIQSAYSEQIKNAETQSKQGKTGLWRACGETDEPPQPCFLFNNTQIDSVSKREALAQFKTVSDIGGYFRYAYYDPVQNEIIVTWQLRLDTSLGNDYLDEYFRLPECVRDRSVIYEK